MTLCPQDLFRAGPPLFTTDMLSASRSLSVPEFLRRSTLGPDGNHFLETIRRPIFNAWSVDTCHRQSSQYQLVSCPKFLHENTRQDGCGALSLENLVRRQIVKHHLGEIDENILRHLEWFGRGKKLWEDVLACGGDSWRVFVRFCATYGHEQDFIAMLEDGGAGLSARGGHAQFGIIFNGKTTKKATSSTNNNFRYRTQVIKDPLPPWESSLPLLTAPKPKLNGGDFSWLVCLELNTESFCESWTALDLQYSLGTLPNLAVLSIHGSAKHQRSYRIVEDGYLSEWARSARQGQKWGSLRILVLEESLDGLLKSYRAPPRHHLDHKRVPPPPPPPRKRGLFEELDSFPKLSVVCFHFPPAPPGWGFNNAVTSDDYRRMDCVYPLFNHTKAKVMFEEGIGRGWFSERVKDFQGTLKERPREIKEFVRKAGLTGMRTLAQAGAMLVQLEAEEREKLVREREADLSIEKGVEKLLRQNGTQTDKKSSSGSSESAPSAQVLSNVAPPVMVNVIFETNEAPNVLPSLRNQAKTDTARGRVSPTDQENFHERRIIFEKKRNVELPPLPRVPSVSPNGGRKRKNDGSVGSTDGAFDADGVDWSLDGAGDWDIDPDMGDGVRSEWGAGAGNKKLRRAYEGWDMAN